VTHWLNPARALVATVLAAGLATMGIAATISETSTLPGLNYVILMVILCAAALGVAGAIEPFLSSSDQPAEGSTQDYIAREDIDPADVQALLELLNEEEHNSTDNTED
jgi:membrane protein implicated in regulation of membrane protease activity